MGRLQHRWIIVVMFVVIFGGQAVRGWTESVTIEDNIDYKDFEPFRPRRYCTPPAIEQFPRPLIGPSARKHSLLIPHILVAVVTFVGLAVVSKDYYVSSLYRICEKSNQTPDVVGATFMAVGSSAPQLAIVIIRMFCAQDDLDVNGVVGLSAYNMVFVVALCALEADIAMPLNWRPFCRDCFFYAISILVMLVAIVNGYVDVLETIYMLVTYGIYCVVLFLGRWISCNCKSGKAVSTQPSNDETQVEIALRNPTSICPDIIDESAEPAHQTLEPDSACPNTASGEQPAAADSAQHEAKHNSEITFNPLIKPNGGNCLQLTWWFVSYPVHWLCRLTIPDSRDRCYISYLVCLLWISFYAFFLVWMITIIGFTLGISDTVMSLTAVSMAVSVPNAISSLAVVKKGYGDMIMSNAIGSSVFNILVCLGLPWFLETVFIHPGSHVNVISKGIVYTTCAAFTNLLIVLVITLACGRRLNKKNGVALNVWFLVFIIVSTQYELNIFGEFNPPVCYSAY